MCIEEHTNAEIGPDGGAPVTCRVVSNWQFWFCF
jgi:hypothetical protein